jgi:hypothetical protein
MREEGQKTFPHNVQNDGGEAKSDKQLMRE